MPVYSSSAIRFAVGRLDSRQGLRLSCTLHIRLVLRQQRAKSISQKRCGHFDVGELRGSFPRGLGHSSCRDHGLRAYSIFFRPLRALPARNRSEHCHNKVLSWVRGGRSERDLDEVNETESEVRLGQDFLGDIIEAPRNSLIP